MRSVNSSEALLVKHFMIPECNMGIARNNYIPKMPTINKFWMRERCKRSCSGGVININLQLQGKPHAVSSHRLVSTKRGKLGNFHYHAEFSVKPDNITHNACYQFACRK